MEAEQGKLYTVGDDLTATTNESLRKPRPVQMKPLSI
jgi:hypothetical protein